MWSVWKDKDVWRKGKYKEMVVGQDEGEMVCRVGSVEGWWVWEREVRIWTLTQILNMVSDNLIWPCHCVVFLSFHSLWMHNDHTPLLSELCAATWLVRACSFNATLKWQQARGQSAVSLTVFKSHIAPFSICMCSSEADDTSGPEKIVSCNYIIQYCNFTTDIAHSAVLWIKTFFIQAKKNCVIQRSRQNISLCTRRRTLGGSWSLWQRLLAVVFCFC